MIPWDCELHQHGAMWPAAVLSPRDFAFTVAENSEEGAKRREVQPAGTSEENEKS